MLYLISVETDNSQQQYTQNKTKIYNSKTRLRKFTHFRSHQQNLSSIDILHLKQKQKCILHIYLKKNCIESSNKITLHFVFYMKQAS